MLSQAERNQIIDLINREVVPAIGCTEPIAVALCTARAAETLGGEPEKITVRLSANILKNAMGVGIPGTGMIGLPIAVALGALVGRSEYQLEVLRDVTPEAVERGRRMIDGRRIAICLKEDVDEKLYIEAEAEAAGHRAVAVIAGGHTSFVFVSRDGETLLDRRTPAAGGGEEEDMPLTLARVWDFAMTSPLDELRFILETSRLNKAAAERSFAGEFGHCVGRTLCCDRERKVMGDSIFTRILSYTSAACDARMAGGDDPRDEQLGKRQPGHRRDAARGGLRRGDARLGGADDPGADVEPPHGHLHQAEPGASVGAVRLRGGGHGIELRHHLPDGRRLRPGGRGREEHDRQPDGHDLRRSQAQLCDEAHERRLDGRAVGHDGHGRPLRHPGRGASSRKMWTNVSATSPPSAATA